MGGVAGAIVTKAEQVMATFGAEATASFDKVFAQLVHLERDRRPTSRQAPLAAFTGDEGATTLIQALAGPDCRILVTGCPGKDATVEVAHEKLFTAWPRLAGWLYEKGEELRLIDHAMKEARLWGERGERPEELWVATRATEALEAFQRYGTPLPAVLGRFLKPQEVLLEHLHQDTLTHQQRGVIGLKLAQFGDPRAGVGLRPDGLPDIVWINIPGGQITLEGIDHVFEVKAFRLAKYPVTNVQFEAFLNANDGYHNNAWWQEFPQPEGLTPPAWNEANCPRERVSWYEAVAFCRWLSHRTGLPIRLPPEWEWQQAATGGDSTYKYPWGKKWDSSRCNSVEAVLNRTSSVGIYLTGATQQGVFDMAGNLWEWCLNTYENPKTAALDLKNSRDRVVRGGSWETKTRFLRLSRRYRSSAADRKNFIGFRLAQDID